VSDVIVATQDVCMTYGRGPAAVVALDGVSLDVRRGEMLMIMGPSGSGKTTLLQILGALVRPTSGAVWIDGRPVEGLSQAALGRLRRDHFGFIFQAYNLIPTLTAWENVAVALDLKGIRGRSAERRSRALLDELGLAHRANAYPAQLSGGQKQRVAIARALAFDPAAILADEPTAALDSGAGRQIADLLHDLAERQGRAVVIVTHDERLMRPGARIAMIEDGRIAGIGSGR
jgi:putative ABC transport system ATP-binding protein